MNFRSPQTALDRRRFLRGLGACIALPALEALLPARLAAAAAAAAPGQLATTATGAPLRSAFIYFPNGAIQPDWWPAGGLTDYVFNRTLQPLESHRSQVQVLRGLDHQNAFPGPDGAGDHARGNGVFLTGVRLNKSATDIRAGVSIDQAIASRVGHLTRFPSLELTCNGDRRSGNCDSGYSCAYQYNLSWKNATSPMTPEANPRKVFERLFGAGPHGQRQDAALRRLQDRRSILDFVTEDARSMQSRLGRGDQDKLDQYLTGIREVEARIQKAEQFGAANDPDLPTPDGIPATHGEHIDLMSDMLALAFQTDSTRVATMIMAHDGDNRPHDEIGIADGHHDLSHHQNKADTIEKVAKIDQWYIRRLAALLKRLDETPDIDGHSLLHNSMIVYGSGNADGNRHTHDNLPLLLAGQGGGALAAGRYVDHASKPVSNLFLTMADLMGADALPRFGDSTGRLGNV